MLYACSDWEHRIWRAVTVDYLALPKCTNISTARYFTEEYSEYSSLP